jgi:hypothetical protein
VLLEFGEVEKALEHARMASELGGHSPLPSYMLSFALAASGDTTGALSVADRLVKASASTYVSPFFVGMSLLAAGDVDRAFEFFDAAQAEKSAWMVWWGTEPKLDRVNDDERYWKLLESTGNPIINILEKQRAA